MNFLIYIFFHLFIYLGTLGFDTTPMIVGLTFGILGIVTTLGYCIVSTFEPNNMCAKTCIGFTPERESKAVTENQVDVGVND